MQKNLQQQCSELNDTSTYFTGKLSKPEAQILLKYCDIGYAGGDNIPKLYRYGIAPNKLFSYLDAELPVLLPMEPCGDPISESCSGIVAPCDSPQEMLEHLETLLDMNDDEIAKISKLGKSHLLKNYDYEKIARKYLSAIFK